MCTKEELRHSIACKLKDEDMVRYTKCTIDDEMQAACGSIMGTLSEYGGFSEEKEVTLTNGKCRQTFHGCLCVLGIIEVNGQECEDIVEDNPSTASDVSHLDADFPPLSCSSTEGEAFVPSSVRPVIDDPNTWVFGDKVPDEGVHTAVIRCVPDIFADTATIPDIICNQLRDAFNHKVLANIYALDNKSANLSNLAQVQLNMYRQAMSDFRNSQFSKSQEDWYLSNRITADGGN